MKVKQNEEKESMITSAKADSTDISTVHLDISSIILKDNSTLSLLEFKNPKKGEHMQKSESVSKMSAPMLLLAPFLRKQRFTPRYKENIIPPSEPKIMKKS
jgi:hypothetical protein